MNTPLTEVQVDDIQGHLQYLLGRVCQERIPYCAIHLNDDPVVDRITKDIFSTILEDLAFKEYMARSVEILRGRRNTNGERLWINKRGVLKMATEYCYTYKYRQLRNQLSEKVREINNKEFIVSTSGGSHVDLLDGWVFKRYPEKSYFSFNTIPYSNGKFATDFKIHKDRLKAIVEAKLANYVYNQKQDSWLWHPEDSMRWILELLKGGIQTKDYSELMPQQTQRQVHEYKYAHSYANKGGSL